MTSKDEHRDAAIRWAFGASAQTGHPPYEAELALARANALLDLVDVYYRVAKVMFGDRDEVRSLARVMDSLHRHAEEMGNAVLLAREVDSAFRPDFGL